MLSAMRYRGFVWPNNPHTYSIEFTRETALHKVPMGAYSMQDLGRSRRVMRGEGEFFGPGAYDTFRALARQFYRSGPGLLVHPVWQSASAYFTSLALTQEPREDYVAYSFSFTEAGMEENSAGGVGLKKLRTYGSGSAGTPVTAGVSGAQYHTVVRGDTLWGIGQRYGKTVAELIRLNPWISNPNLIYAGQEVRVQ